MIIRTSTCAFRIPTQIARYRANCSREWGQWVSGDTKKMTAMSAAKAGMCHGDFQEFAVAHISEKILTFQPHYEKEPFAEIWGFPVAGGIAEKGKANSSTLCTFLLHRQSKDSLMGLMEQLSSLAFNAWMETEMDEDPDSFIAEAIKHYLSEYIFSFQMESRDGEFGSYFFVKCSFRPAAPGFESEALDACRIVREKYACQDPMIEENHAICTGSSDIVKM